jgi:hypothetical protein
VAGYKENEDLLKVFQETYKYYRGWAFEYVYPGYFAYHQMGGELSVYFTPDWNKLGHAAIQISNLQGEVFLSKDVSYNPPERNGKPYEKVLAWVLFRTVRPFLEEHMDW